MMFFPVVLPLAEITFLVPPPPAAGPDAALFSTPFLGVALGVVLALLVLVGTLRRVPRRKVARRKVASRKAWIVVDGSNVMHWQDETPRIATVQAVVQELTRRGFAPGVVFDANAGYKLEGRYLGPRDLARRLGLPEDQVMVVPKGTPADPWLLSAARQFGARVVSRDRFRDWAADHPEVNQPGFLIRGGYRDSGALWLDDSLAGAERAVH
jgi:hypothetical protein